jgi:para-aminobenzoate synthetase/4-amino-4-deoxychorismate lyase
VTFNYALVQAQHNGATEWLEFKDPKHVYIADNVSQVQDCIENAETAAKAGNWVVGFLTYEAGPAFDRAFKTLPKQDAPLACFGVFDQATVVAEPFKNTTVESQRLTWHADTSEAEFKAALERIKSYIAAGDTYQVNYTLRLHAAFTQSSFDLFANMFQAQQCRYAAYLDLDRWTICSASPELLFDKRGTRLVSSPMKGTRARHPLTEQDSQLIEDLKASAKDRAENTMIVDMVRNDLGRIANYGSLALETLHRVETYPTVHQLVSTVAAESAASLYEILKALFPAASITGAPKYRTSEIIAELENEPRGIYTGTIGVIDPQGNAQFNVAIRTAWIDKATKRATFGAGAGIVWDSEPTAEWQEIWAKAKILSAPSIADDFELFETIRWEPQLGCLLQSEHLDRLGRAAKYFDFPFDQVEAASLLMALSFDSPQRLRLCLRRDGQLVCGHSPLPQFKPYLSVALDSEPIDKSDKFLFFKTSQRQRYDQALACQPGFDDVILWNFAQEITETTIGNLVVKIDGRYVTPTRNSGLLDGTLRQKLIDQKIVEEQPITIKQALASQEIYMINSVRGWIKLH